MYRTWYRIEHENNLTTEITRIVTLHLRTSSYISSFKTYLSIVYKIHRRGKYPSWNKCPRHSPAEWIGRDPLEEVGRIASRPCRLLLTPSQFDLIWAAQVPSRTRRKRQKRRSRFLVADVEFTTIGPRGAWTGGRNFRFRSLLPRAASSLSLARATLTIVPEFFDLETDLRTEKSEETNGRMSVRNGKFLDDIYQADGTISNVFKHAKIFVRRQDYSSSSITAFRYESDASITTMIRELVKLEIFAIRVLCNWRGNGKCL